ncbi:hypothetical protein EMIHUDRAFT_217387 [Emiliania huxleyi CCMP1516]|uniref:Sulfatase N-terminal domain-containing protein n=2 Tax=Emiliania huxleyi TaxID=2903 RepID=A0A0D3IBK9_EMIH1|nr:hypothetical protein EMIHUDRAFT_217387 [Emiliania huxleyi CCMP1516]EOD08644.1 hypothetical protein EMIHUDRAFT_217387 [Emiliania huxleyi CCMP1516]|eukprot:XP_005761073.1 hypothetical protein EMIHUDRAFT_217387 [Emiliania huxleyi CCMP1516]
MIADDLRPTLGTYGSTEIHSPHIDALAADSVVFERAYCQVPTCGASRASMLTGLYPTPERFLQYDSFASLEGPPGIPDLPATLQAAGYTTISNGKIYHNRDDNVASFNQICGHGGTGGITESEHFPGVCRWQDGMCCLESLTEPPPQAPAVLRSHNSGRPDHPYDGLPAEVEEEDGEDWDDYTRSRWGCFGCNKPAFRIIETNGDDFRTAGLPDGKMTLKVIKDLRLAHATKTPFFITVGFFRPHLPFDAPRRDWDLYNRSQLPLAEFDQLPDGAPPRSLNFYELPVYKDIPPYSIGNHLPEDLTRTLIHGYYASITYVDRLVGYIMDEVKSLGMYDDTIIMLASDHGYQLNDHGTWCKHSLYEKALRVPLMIKAPGFRPSRVQAMVENLDIYPTLLDLIEVQPPAHLQGESLVPLLRDARAQHKDAVFARYLDGDTVRFPEYAYSEYCSRTCTQIPACRASCATIHPTDRMLYNHTLDPFETASLHADGKHGAVANVMGRVLQQHRRDRERVAEV